MKRITRIRIALGMAGAVLLAQIGDEIAHALTDGLLTNIIHIIFGETPAAASNLLYATQDKTGQDCSTIIGAIIGAFLGCV